MTQDKHTPGPWLVEMPQEWPFSILIEPNIIRMDRYAYGTGNKSLEDVRSAASFPHKNREHISAKIAEQEANARLIAASPDMLEALIECRGLLAALCGPDEAVANAVIRQADAAIAKAKGSNAPLSVISEAGG